MTLTGVQIFALLLYFAAAVTAAFAIFRVAVPCLCVAELLMHLPVH